MAINKIDYLKAACTVIHLLPNKLDDACTGEVCYSGERKITLCARQREGDSDVYLNSKVSLLREPLRRDESSQVQKRICA